jgi:hypothetical protein
MRLGLGLSVHTGWAACVLAGGDVASPHVLAREHVELAGDPERFVYHRAAEMAPDQAAHTVARLRDAAVKVATSVLSRLARQGDVRACAVVAKDGEVPDLATVVASHPRIHTCEGLFYRDVLLDAARQAGLRAHPVHPRTLDPNDPRLAAAGRALGKPWNRDWKIASLAAWKVLSVPRA